jgi:hypothetical protein
MRPFRLVSALRCSLLGLPLCFASPLAAQTAASPPPFVETIEVREVEVRVDLAALPRLESIGRRGIEDFIVVENGVAHPLTELTEAESSQWIFVLYFDSILANPAARQQAAIAFAGRAAQLTAGGLAEIVVADPRPHTILSTGDRDVLRRALDELALAAGNEPSPSALPPKLASAAAGAQLDRLSLEIAARGGGGSRALLLPVSSWPIDPESLAALERERAASGLPAAAAAASTEFRPLLETARVLAGYGWVTLPVALRPAGEVVPPSAAEQRVESTTGGGGDRRTTVTYPVLSSRENRDPDATTEAQLDTVTDFTLTPFAELSRATSGALIGQTDRLRTALDRIAGRKQFTYRSPFPEPGRLLALEVRWKSGDGRLLAAPRWLRSSTPPEVSAARLRRLLAGDPVPTASGIRFDSTEPAVCFAGEGEKRWVRISTATKSGGEVRISTGQPVQLTRGERGLCADRPRLSSNGSGVSTVLLAEDLENESWTGVVETSH